MSEQKYTPIACGSYDQFELAAMRRQWLNLRWTDDQGKRFSATLRPLDLRVQDKAEFLIAEDDKGNQVRLRLDRIESAGPA